MSVLVSRTLLGLADLEINDFENYYVASQFLGANAGWNRTQIGAPWTDGTVTVNRTRQMVNEPLAVEVFGGDLEDVKNNVAELLDAFAQDAFTIDVTMDGFEYAKYQCEAADVQHGWVGARFIEGQVQIVFSVPRQPVPLVGV